MYGCIIHIIVDRLSDNQIHRIMIYIKTKDAGKNNYHYQHDHERIQDTPEISQKASAVFQLHILCYQLDQKITVSHPPLFSIFVHRI